MKPYYTLTENKRVFVRDPNLRGRYLITDASVINVTCGQCGAMVLEPCFSLVRGVKKYSGGTHYVRRRRYQHAKSFKS